MRTAYRAANLIDAHLVKDALEQAQIPAFIAGEYLAGGVGQLPVMDYLSVMVPESSAGAADEVVRTVEAALVEARVAIGEYDVDPGATPVLVA